jgi:hypothetical protein
VHNTEEAYWNGLDLEMGTGLPHVTKLVMTVYGDTVLALIKAIKLLQLYFE